jgi:hypothetical protein
MSDSKKPTGSMAGDAAGLARPMKTTSIAYGAAKAANYHADGWGVGGAPSSEGHAEKYKASKKRRRKVVVGKSEGETENSRERSPPWDNVGAGALLVTLAITDGCCRPHTLISKPRSAFWTSPLRQPGGARR